MLLIFGVVLWPAIEMVRTSLLKISISGVTKGFAGSDNYQALFANPELPGVLTRTFVWVRRGGRRHDRRLPRRSRSSSNARFPGRRFVRWALIVPWAASVVMTATVWRWMLNAFYGVMNRVLLDLHLISGPVDWLGNPSVAFAWLMARGGLRVPAVHHVRHPRRPPVHPRRRCTRRRGWTAPALGRRTGTITLPLLRPALLVATIINMINVFNSFPIIWVMTNGGPGYQTDTTTTFMYKVAFRNQNVGQSAAMAVVNFGDHPGVRAALPAERQLARASLSDDRTPDAQGPASRASPYLVAFLFLAPYLEMLLTALRPHDELFQIPADYLPSHFEWDNFIKVWQEAPVGGYLKSSLVIAGCRHAGGAARVAAGRVLHGP